MADSSDNTRVSTEPLAVEVRGLRQSYERGLFRRSIEVLHGIDLALRAGEFVGLVGPNGSGKSTLMRVRAAVDEPSAGSARVFGRAPDHAQARRATGFCPEDSPFPRELSAAQVLDVLGSLYGLARAQRRERAAELLDLVGLSASAKRPLASYSRGMLRRFGLAQALLHQPTLLLLDEPTAGLDALGFEVFERLLESERARGTTAIVSSHLLSDLQRRCERLVVLVEGRIEAQGTAQELVGDLGERARFELSVSGLGPRELELVQREIERLGGQSHGVQPAQFNLFELYRRGRARAAP